MRILVVSSYYYPASIYGGPVKSIHKRSLYIKRLGCHLLTFTTAANGCNDLSLPLEQPVDTDGLPVIYFSRWWFGRWQKPFTLFFSPAMGRQLRQLQPGDFNLVLIHAVWGDPGRMAAAAARRARTPYIYYTHGCFEPWALRHKQWKKWLYWKLIEKRILQGAAGIVVCNEAEAEQLRTLGIRTPIRRIPWGMEMPVQGQIPLREKLELSFPNLKHRPFFLFLSRLHPKKGLDMLIRAFALLAHEFPDWLLVLAGPDEGGYRSYLEKLARDFGIAERVIFTGMVTGEAKAALLSHADLFVLPSYSEGFPVVVGEALGYGLPMIITTTCHVPEVETEGAGLVVPPEMESLTAALRDMMGNESLRRQCGANAYRLARTRFTWDAVAQKSMTFFREVIDSQVGNFS